MKDEKDRVLCERGLAFFGVITASLSHEINNVVAIIKELSGLLDDLLVGAERGREINNEKLKQLSLKIGNQVRKGESVIKTLNRFAHSIDDPVKDIDLKEFVDEIAAIAQRFAFLKMVRLTITECADGSMTVRICPFYLQQAVFICIELVLANSKKDEAVNLTYRPHGAGWKIVVTGTRPPDSEEIDSELLVLSDLMQKIGGSVQVVPLDNGRQAFELLLPASIPDECTPL